MCKIVCYCARIIALQEISGTPGNAGSWDHFLLNYHVRLLKFRKAFCYFSQCSNFTCLVITIRGKRVKTKSLSVINPPSLSAILSLMTGLCHRNPASCHCSTRLSFHSSVCPPPPPYSSQI